MAKNKSVKWKTSIMQTDNFPPPTDSDCDSPRPMAVKLSSPDEGEGLCNALLEMSFFPITISSVADGRFLLVNESWRRVTGFSEQDALGRTAEAIGAYLDPVDQKKLHEQIEKDGEVKNFECRVYHKDGLPYQNHMRVKKVRYMGEDCLLAMTASTSALTQAQEALAESEARFRNILSSIKENYYEVDLKGNVTFFNDSVLTLFGLSAQELKGMNFKDYTLPEDIPKVFAAYNEVYLGLSSVKCVECGIIHKEGPLVHVETSVSLLHDDSGKPIGFCGIIRDRTEQKKAEEALRRSEEKYRGILEEMEEGYYETDLKGNLTYFNKSVALIYGYSAGELLGMHHNQYLKPEQVPKTDSIFNRIYQTGDSVLISDYEILCKDGSIRNTEVSGYPLRDEHGEIVGFWGITRDRTEQKQAETALKKSEEQYRLLVNNASDGIYITQKGLMKYFNPKTSKMTGYSDQELADLNFVDLVYPEDRATIYDVQQRRLEEGEAPDVFCFRILNQARKILWVELSAIGITWEGEPAALNFLRDVTHLKKMENHLMQAQKMEAIGTLAGGIAHDFNNILSSIIGFTELILEDLAPDTLVAENAAEVLVAGKRAKDLVQQILTFARQADKKTEPVVVGNVVKEALKLIRSTIPATIEIKPEIKSYSSILGNPTQVHQIIMNLCTNAAHALERSGGSIKVTLQDIVIIKEDSDFQLDLIPGDYLRLSVADTGCGMAPHIIGSIFEPYFTTKGPGEGTGMGLSVVQGIVENYGGRIVVKSKLEKGTTFTIYLPVLNRPKAYQEKVEDELLACSEQILFVDDEVTITKMAGQILARLGYQVTTQTSSAKALKLFRSKPGDFDLIITDMTMPVMTGDRLAIEMMKIRPDIPVIICTGYSKLISEEKATEIGINAFVYKPIEKKELAATVRKVLDGRSAAAE